MNVKSLFRQSLIRKTALVLGLALLALTPQSLQALPFNDDMVDVQPNAGEMTRPRVEGTVPVGGLSEALLSKEKALTLVNPLRGDEDTLVRGKVLFQVNCSACHGNIGAKEYVPGVAGSKMGAPDLSHEMYRERTDGHIFSYIRYGGAIMPALGWKLSQHETWEIISYVREVQGKKEN